LQTLVEFLKEPEMEDPVRGRLAAVAGNQNTYVFVGNV
jgi:hypothetical protein